MSAGLACYRASVIKDGSRWQPIIAASDSGEAATKAGYLYGVTGATVEYLHPVSEHDGGAAIHRGGQLVRLAHVGPIDRRKATTDRRSTTVLTAANIGVTLSSEDDGSTWTESVP